MAKRQAKTKKTAKPVPSKTYRTPVIVRFTDGTMTIKGTSATCVADAENQVWMLSGSPAKPINGRTIKMVRCVSSDPFSGGAGPLGIGLKLL
jgi:hypothetical protein